MLLADEVGLGKTIEAGMILAHLLASGRIARVLVLLPEALVYQWFVELLRRFNLQFSIFDEERCEAIEQGGDARNPFQDEQLVITDLAFLTAQQTWRAGAWQPVGTASSSMRRITWHGAPMPPAPAICWSNAWRDPRRI